MPLSQVRLWQADVMLSAFGSVHILKHHFCAYLQTGNLPRVRKECAAVRADLFGSLKADDNASPFGLAQQQ